MSKLDEFKINLLPTEAEFDRRTLLRAGAAAALAAPLAGVARAATAALAVSDLPGGLKLISGAGASVVACAGPGGALMVDGGVAARADEVIAAVLAQTKAQKVGTLFNTCWRLEQTGANDKLGAAGTPIVAHENTRLWMTTEIDAQWEKKVYPPRAKAAQPTRTFYDTREQLAAGPEQVEYGYLLQAHTDGDMYVFFRKANVIVAGAAVAGRGWPVIDTATGGFVGNHIRGLETLAKLADDKTVIVPADGNLVTKADLVKQQAMYTAIMAKLQTALESGWGLAQVLQSAPAADYVAERGDPTQFLTLSFRSLWGHVRQFKAI
jgi:glyoxylase-like metal-dependent hydrolase (beta-lactamase superfamily II)